MSDNTNTGREDFSEDEWWESIPDLKLVDDIDPQVFSLVESKQEEEPNKEEDVSVVSQIEDVLADTAQHIEEVVGQRVKPEVSLPKRIGWGILYWLRHICGILVIAAVGSVLLTWILNYANNHDYTIGDAANFLVSSIVGTLNIVAGFFGLA